MTLTEFGSTSACLALGAVVQSVTGFGMGVVAIPLLVSTGQALPFAMGALMPCVLCQTAYSCWRVRRELPWRATARVVGWRLLGLPIGVHLLGTVADRGQAACRVLLGIAVVGLLLIPERPSHAGPRGRSRFGWLWLAGFSSGVLMGLISMGGPPLVAWVLRQDWSQRRQRAFLWLTFLLVLPAQLVLMEHRCGVAWTSGFWLGTYSILPVIAISWVAGTWADRLSKERIRWGMRVLLFMLALKLVCFPEV